MKGVKGKLLKKLKSIKPIGSLKQDRILQVKASDGYIDFLPKIPSFNLYSPFASRENESKKVVQSSNQKMQQEEPEVIDVSELMRDLEEEEEEDDDEINFDDYSDNKENIGPFSVKSNHQFGHKGISETREETEPKQSKKQRVSVEPRSSQPRADEVPQREIPLSEIDVTSFRRPDLNSRSLFDPNLLAAFEQAVKEHLRMTEEQRKNRVETEPIENSCIIEEDEEEDGGDPLLLFEEKCPPGGDGCVIFYTTTLRGIRKTFEDCNKIRFLLESFKVVYFERDISMHKEFREELWSTLDGKTLPPRLFVKGRYIGGAEEVVSLHEQGKLRQLFEGIPRDCSEGPCEACGGIRFVLCFKCSGSHKVIEENGDSNQCPECNENGLIKCPYCS